MKNKLRVLHLSDTHGFHDLLNVPQDIDVLAFTGDESNRRDPYFNEAEFYDFAEFIINEQDVPKFEAIIETLRKQ